MNSEQVERFLRALDLRLDELERDLRDSEKLQQRDRSRDLRTESETISALKATFLEVLGPARDGA